MYISGNISRRTLAIILVGVAYWLLDSAIDSLIFKKGSFISQIIDLPAHEIFMRMIITALLIALSYVFFVSSRQKKTDITLKAAAVRVEDERYKTESIIEAIGDGVTIQDRNFRILYQNQAAQKMIGNHIGELCYMAYEQREQRCEGCPVAMVFEDSRVHTVIRTANTDKGMLYLENTASPVRNSKGEIIAGIEVVHNITERKKLETALLESEERLRTIITTEPHCVKLVNADGTLIEMNPAGLAMIEADSLDQVKGASLYSIIAPDYLKAFKDHIEKIFRGSSGTLEFEIIGLKGTHRWLATHSVPFRNNQGEITALLGITRDITEQRKLEDQLQQAQKMESIGLLAGGVAHDFNNILSAIIGYTHLTLMKMPDGDPLRNNLEQILQASERATTLTHSLLAFSRKQPVNLQPIDLNQLIKNFEKFMLRLLTENIELHTSYSEEELQTVVDRGQIEQVLMNLITNARDAIPEGGRITIETSPVFFDKESAQIHGLEKAGEYALIIVSDTGSGIDKENIDKIFEPFFTTKEMGRGTGLGLAIVYGIIKKHEGNINVYSEQGKGTSFKIYLPVQRTVSGEMETHEKLPPAKGGSETILIAEDDASLRKLSKTVLVHYGYNVIEALDGEDAVNKFIANKDDIRLIILDGIMPRKNGKEAYDEISVINPDIKVIFISGYSEDIFRSEEVIEKGLICLLKPVSPNELLLKVREILDR